MNSDLSKILNLKSTRCHAGNLPEGAILSTELLASESQVLQCLAPQAVDNGIYAAA